MEKTLKIQISCGEKTCASEPGKFCRFFGSINFGSTPVCVLFPSEDNSYTKLFQNEDKDSKIFGWTERCKSCLNIEEKK